MNYEEKYKEALETVQEMLDSGSDSIKLSRLRLRLQSVFPELKEDEDEKMLRSFKSYLQEEIEAYTYDCRDEEDRQKLKMFKYVQALLEKQSKKEQLYIRFGEIPANEKSKIYNGEIEAGTENGVSVYQAFITDGGNIVLGLTLPITRTTLHTQQHLIEYDDRPCYLVKGDYVGEDADGQPLINNVSIIKKIDRYRAKEEEQSETDSSIKWHSMLEKPEEMRELLCEWDSADSTWHEVAFYHSDNGTFWNGERQVRDVSKWCYIDELSRKQDEQGLADKASPKFKAGDWIACKGFQPARILNIANDKYEIEFTENGARGVHYVDFIDRHWHLWTVQDAEDGDVLVLKRDKSPFIFKGFDKYNPEFPVAHCGIGVSGKLVASGSGCWTDEEVEPATKKQRDLFFTKLKQERYCNPNPDLIEIYEAFVKRHHYLG